MNLSNPNKSEKKISRIADLELDFTYSNLNSPENLKRLAELMVKSKFKEGLNSLFKSNNLNSSENRSEDHIALRDFEGNYKFSISEEVKAVEMKQKDFVNQFQLDVNIGLFEAVIVLGVGGSSLGVSLVCKALESNYEKLVEYIIVDNVDSVFVNKITRNYNLSKCLFVVSSKTFTTLETMKMANIFKRELISLKGDDYNWTNNFIAITANVGIAKNFGINEARIFKFWDSISGRFSVWLAIGLPLDLIFGTSTHLELRKGAGKLDKAFLNDLTIENPIIQYAFMQFENLERYNSKAEAIVAYDSSLGQLSNYLQQLYMESLGKAYTSNNVQIDNYTCPLIFGGIGTNDQHSYFQLLHQGKQTIPITFIEVKNKKVDKFGLQEVLNNNLEAQRTALFEGRLEKGGPLCKQFYGGNPNVKLSLEELAPFTLGQLMAFYEHVVFVLSQLNRVNCFDQWGVELGKKIYKENIK